MLRPVVLLALAAAPLAAQTFEGVVSLTLTSERGPMPLEYQIKDGKIRLEMSGGGMQMGMIIDPAAKKMLMIVPQQRMYMEQDLAESMGSMEQRAGAGRGSVTRTGRTETIAGFKCEHITITDATGSANDACVTSELGAAFQFPMGGGMMGRGRGAAPAWAAGLENAFPLKVQHDNATVLEVTKIERRTLDPGLFAPPEGFQKMTMPGMMKRP